MRQNVKAHAVSCYRLTSSVESDNQGVVVNFDLGKRLLFRDLVPATGELATPRTACSRAGDRCG